MTLLVIIMLSGPMEGHEARLPYPSLDACYAASRAVSDTLSDDHSLDCITAVRPMRNPIYGEK